MLQLIQAFPAHHQTLKLTNSWYNLSLDQQVALVEQALHQVQELDFGKLEVTDLKGTLRRPVVGTNRGVIQRQLSSVPACQVHR